jgi:hypothetical protein
MTKPFKELRDEVMADPERAALVESETQRLLADQDRYERDKEFRARVDRLIEEENGEFDPLDRE